MKKIFLLLSLIVYYTPIWAGCDRVNGCEEKNGIWYLLIDKSKVAEVNYSLGKEYKGDIVIPDKVTFDGIEYDVLFIGEKAFYDSPKVTSITLPSSIVEIKQEAFLRCTGLNSLVIPEGVTKIDSYAFARCSNLVEVKLPNSLEKLGGGAFYYCTSLTDIKLPNGLKTLEGGMFDRCTSLEKIVIPDNITFIGGEAFLYCLKLSEVTLGANVQYIDYRVFGHCDALANVYCYSEEVPETHEQAFYYDYAYDSLSPHSYSVTYTRLYVPSVSLNKYKESNTWKDFMQILPISKETLIKNVRNDADDGREYNLNGLESYSTGVNRVKIVKKNGRTIKVIK